PGSNPTGAAVLHRLRVPRTDPPPGRRQPRSARAAGGDPSGVRRLELARGGVIGPVGDGWRVIGGHVGARERSDRADRTCFAGEKWSFRCTKAPPGPSPSGARLLGGLCSGGWVRAPRSHLLLGSTA